MIVNKTTIYNSLNEVNVTSSAHVNSFIVNHSTYSLDKGYDPGPSFPTLVD